MINSSHDMITSLTDAQRAKFPDYIKHWTEIGLSTNPANRPKAESGIIKAYSTAGLPAPKIVWCSSPLANGLTRAIVGKIPQKRDSVGASVGASVRASVGDSVRASVWASVWDSVWASVGASVRDSVGDSVGASVWASVGDSGYGQHDANWIGFYNFFRSELSLLEQTEKLEGMREICENAGWFLPHEKICWVCERHNVINRNAQGRLHKDGAIALAYPDGWGIYALNGIRMKPEYVLTPAEKINPETVLREANADVRRELLRKVGVERMMSKLPHKSMDKRGDYELFSINLGEGASDARYLKMVNQSIGCFHLEGVAPECNTVEKSLAWRNEQKFVDAEILT